MHEHYSYSHCPSCGQEVIGGQFLCGHTPKIASSSSVSPLGAVMETRLIQGLPAIPTKQRGEEWSAYWQRAFDERTSQLASLCETISEQAKDVEYWKGAYDTVYHQAMELKYVCADLRETISTLQGENQELRQVVRAYERMCLHCDTGSNGEIIQCFMCKRAVALLEPVAPDQPIKEAK